MTTYETLVPYGAVIIRGLLEDDLTNKALRVVVRRGECQPGEGGDTTPNGFYTEGAPGFGLNHGQGGHRGRVYDSIESLQNEAINEKDAYETMTHIAKLAVDEAHSWSNGAIPNEMPTHMHFKRYHKCKNGGIYWHMDGANIEHGEVVQVPGHIDGTNENAIVTLCLGNSATFKCCARPYNRRYGKEADFGCIAARVNHGDIIVWGGPHGRWLSHAVNQIAQDDAPESAKNIMVDRDGDQYTARISVTFRVTPELAGQEANPEFQNPDMGY